MKKLYKVCFYFGGDEDNVEEMEQYLAQAVADEFDVEQVYGVEIEEEEIES